MKKQMLLFVSGAVAFGISALVSVAATADGERCNGGAASRPGIHIRNNITVNNHETQIHVAGFEAERGPDMFYMMPSRRAGMYQDFNAARTFVPPPPPPPQFLPPPPPPVQVAPPPPRPVRTTPPSSMLDRDTHLAHPFFQPIRGRFASVSDIGITRNSFDWHLRDVFIEDPVDTDPITGDKGNWSSGQTFIKQDFLYGLTDELSAIVSIKYASNRAAMDWDFPRPTPPAGSGLTNPLPRVSDLRWSDSGIDQAGAGFIWRFYDSGDWVANAAAYYIWTEFANSIAAEARLGHNIGDTTVYGLVRVMGTSWDGDSYGPFIEDLDIASYYIPFNRNISATTNAEVGLGVFSALDDSWSVGGQFVIGDYDWHSQANISASVNFQPTPNIAIGLYGRMSVWNTAEDQDDVLFCTGPNVNDLACVSFIDISGYADMAFGVRGMLYF
ncbi:MAG: hypothetical protein FWE64_00590 [Alphaproteobacteria bacterium]|nr:hypothetical protein [Alphaproteobacteria bacterium]